MSLVKYIKSAFANRWNLLALFGGLGFSVVSGRPDVVAPLILAAEAAYLGFLGTHPRFQQSVDAREAATEREMKAGTSQQALRQIIQQLPSPALSRFEKLRGRCMELRQIAADLQNSQSSEPGAPPFDSIQVASLDRLLWIFLRLLFTEHSLNKFLERANLERIHADVDAFELRLKRQANDQSPHAQKIRKTLEDSLQTSKDRLANYEKAQANHELVELEIDRLESKIKSLAELSINRQEPDFISSQVDQVAGSMLETEKTMNELQFATGLAPIDEEVPELVRSPPIQIVR